MRRAERAPVVWRGEVRAIYVALETGAPCESRDVVEVLAGAGILGDRYAGGEGRFSGRSGGDLTLIEEEAVEAVRRDYGLDVDAALTRRNVVTAGVPLNHLVGRTFRLGPVVVRGARLAEPCSYMAKLAGVPQLRAAFLHRGGLRADVVAGGTLRVGDAVVPAGGEPGGEPVPSV